MLMLSLSSIYNNVYVYESVPKYRHLIYLGTQDKFKEMYDNWKSNYVPNLKNLVPIADASKFKFKKSKSTNKKKNVTYQHKESTFLK